MKITSIDIFNRGNYRLGDKIQGRIVSQIKDNSVSEENNFIPMYWIVDQNNKNIFEVINWPVILELEE